MKKIRLIVALILALSMLSACFVSCRNNTDGKEEDDYFYVNEFSVMYAQNSSSYIQKAAATLKNQLTEIGASDITISDDWYLESEGLDETKNEILIGETNRTVSDKVKAKLEAEQKENAFIIENIENKIVIMGKSDEVTRRAVKYFITNFVMTSEKEGSINIEKGYSKIHTVNTDSMMFENLTEIEISELKTVIAPDIWAQVTYQYPKAIQLQHQSNASDNGTIIATLNSGEAIYRISKSTDNGDTWSEIAQVADELNSSSGMRGGRMPTLYELPADVGEFKKGTIFLAGTTSYREKDTKEGSAIVLYYSTDIGETWTTYQSIDYAKGKVNGDGIWEPFLIYEEETKRLYCFYSDDSDPEHDQKLVYKYTTDLNTWVGKDGNTGAEADPREAVACSDKKLRPGMISIAKMGNGEYIMTYEMVGESMNPIYYKKTASLDDWGDISDKGTKIVSDKGQSFGSSPWCAWSPVGGECGTLVVVAKHWTHEGSLTEKNAPDVFFSFDYGKTFTSIENPIDYTINEQNRCGYSPCVFFSADGKTLYYFNNPNYGKLNDGEYIAMVRIELK